MKTDDVDTIDACFREVDEDLDALEKRIEALEAAIAQLIRLWPRPDDATTTAPDKA